MGVRFILFVCCLFSITSCKFIQFKNNDSVNEVSRIKKIFSFDWNVKRGDTLHGVWSKTNLPHTTQIEPLIVNNQWQGITWYKKTFNISSNEKLRKHFIYFEGVMQEATVWCNGQLITHHLGGFLPFTADISSNITIGENQLVVKVINTDNNQIPPGKNIKDLDFNLYGGIYRNVHHITTNPIYITDAVKVNKKNSGGLLVNFDQINTSLAKGSIKVHLQNDSEKDTNVSLEISFEDSDHIKTVKISEVKKIEAFSDTTFIEQFDLKSPKLWSPENPNLYKCTVRVLQSGRLIDQLTINTGVRSIVLNEKGFFLNGKKRFINGTNRHQEYPYVGYAISDQANYRDAFKIKEAGFDFVRLSHYPHSESFMEACNELGLMTMNCIPGWQYFEEGAFVQNSFKDIRDLIHRDRNHPSVIFWENSLNESGMTPQYMEQANAIVREELPYKDIYTAGWIDHESYDLYIPARQHGTYPNYWNNYSANGRKVFIAEYGDWEYYAQNAGFNQKSFANLKQEERTSRQLRGVGEKGLLQQATNFQEAFNSNLIGKNTIGHANWLMFDYNRGYSDDLESSGISDIFRIPKYSYYFYKSQKSPYNTVTTSNDYMLYIATEWNEVSPPQITIFSNVAKVSLFVDGVLVSTQKPTIDIGYSENLKHPPFQFEVTNSLIGTSLKAIGYDSNGTEVVSKTLLKPKRASKIELSVDISGKEIADIGDDILFIYAKIIDENGTVITKSDELITFSIEDKATNAKLIGKNPIKLEAGIATILLKTSKEIKRPLTIKAISSKTNITTSYKL